MTPAACGKKWLEGQFFYVGKTEHWNPFAHRRVDLFTFLDALAFKPTEPGVIGIQYCGRYEMPRKMRQLKENPMVRLWLRHPTRKLWVLGVLKNEVKVEEFK